MPPSRFANVSKWRNAIVAPAKSDQRYHELGLAPPPDAGSFVRVSSDWIVAKAANSASLLLLPHRSVGKYARQPPSFHASPTAISDFALSHFDDGLAAVGADNGGVAVYRLPNREAPDAVFPPVLTQTPELLINLNASGAAPVSSLAFHPTSSGLLSASRHNTVAVYDVVSANPALELAAQSPVLSIDWAQDGISLAATSKDGIVSLFDARASSKPTSTTQAHASKVKPARLAFVWSHLITTGFSAMREREWAIWDPRSLQQPVKRATIDVSTGVIAPLVDQDRGLVYLLGKGDATLRWLEVDDAKSFTEGNCPLNFTIGGGGLAPSSVHRVMEGEVGRLFVASSTAEDCIVPVSVTIPRRQYIDFHPDLYPPTSSRVAAQSASAWIRGRDADVQRISQDPARASTERQEARRLAENAGAASLAAESKPSYVNKEEAIPAMASSVPTTPAQPKEPSAVTPRSETADKAASWLDQQTVPPTSQSRVHSPNQPSSGPVQAEAAAPTSATVPTGNASQTRTQTRAPTTVANGSKAITASDNNATPGLASTQTKSGSTRTTTAQQLASPRRVLQPTAAPRTKPNPRWSRRFLLGSTPLIAAHQNLSGLDLGLPPDGRMLAANDRFLLFPLAGPGGRLGVHPIKDTGRMPTLIPALTTSSRLVDFALDPFDSARAASLHEDAAIRIWRLPESGDALAHQAVETPELLLLWNKAGKQSELAFHPSAKDLLATCSPETGGKLLLWNLAQPSEPVAIPIKGDGSTSLCWSPGGEHIALSCKDKAIRVITPKGTGSAASTTHVDPERASRSFLERTVVFASHPDRPHVTLTFAQSVDGKIAGEGKKQLALSGKESMLMTHTLRTMHDGILVGIGTVLNDNPQLNARLLSSPPPTDRLPRPVVLDSSLKTPVDCKLIRNAKNGIGRTPLIVCSGNASAERKQALTEAGAEVVELPASEGQSLDWRAALAVLSQHGITRLMVEGGAAVIDSLMARQDLVDTLLVTVAPRSVGETGFGFTAPVPFPLSGSEQAKGHLLQMRAEEEFGVDRVIVWDQADRAAQADNAGNPVSLAPSMLTLRFSDLRNFRLAWIDEQHLVVVGHTVGSARQLRLIRVAESGLEEKNRMTLETSPALLFPSYDADTNVLWLWSKGERLISTYEVRVEGSQPFTALSTFQHQQPQLGVAFLSKKDVDPRKVEIAISYRIEKGEIRRVSWTVPRLRSEYFQDDIFVPTRDTTQPLTTATRWLSGQAEKRRPAYLDLRPSDMEPLSQAPEIKKESKLLKGPIAKELTEEERKEKILDGIFKKAKTRGGAGYEAAGKSGQNDDDDHEEEYPIGSAAKRAPDDDDWSD
ncbi:hypothetical protein ACQY0O_001905 [Thecaphora frezii]